MENVGFVPVCKSMQKSRRNTRYHRLKSIKEVSECSQSSNVFSQKMKMVEDIPKAQRKIRLSTNVLKRLRDAYVEGMLSFAENVAHMNSSRNIWFQKKV
ncbi:hypothetical protein Lal_00002980 [Lupinus albus]|uniref:Uncharacterized protein n=1 Tax=Lupinus albus TaxID=3870 RepID=A0A6A4NL07_LUPAL|nr:hypothetical protein Lalb_Chr22g0353231 [Lupinus albus]KAF1882799.1 hypothetical protein Lal_00002980 [Lupinus albus]